MSRTATQDLTSLLPTVSDLPPELIELASSLLAQSRHKATSLKQEEEVARSYACAHLACERLKTRLDLPAITARPPCPPRVYKKLYTFLDSALPTRTPRKRAREAGEDVFVSIPKNAVAEDRVDVKRIRPAAPAAARSNKRQRVQAQKSTDSDNDHKNLLPFIRRVCDVLGSKAATPHVYSGVCVQAKAFEPDQFPTLVIGIAVVVIRRLGHRLVVRPFEAAAATLLEFDSILLGLGAPVTEEGIIDKLVADSSECMDAHEHEWRRTDWYHNLETQVIDDEEHATDESGPDPALEEDDLSAVKSSNSQAKSHKKRKAVQDEHVDRPRPGLGTMFCDAVDWLSDDRRAAYRLWRRDIIAQIESLA